MAISVAILEGLAGGVDLVGLLFLFLYGGIFLKGEWFVCILGATDFIALRVDTYEVMLGHQEPT
jgi:hypothetical protein